MSSYLEQIKKTYFRLKLAISHISKKFPKRWRTNNDIPTVFLLFFLAISGLESWFYAVPVWKVGPEVVQKANLLPLSELLYGPATPVLVILAFLSITSLMWKIAFFWAMRILTDRTVSRTKRS